MIEIKNQFIPKYRTEQRSGIVMRPAFITIHSTGNPNSTAQNEADYVCYNSDRRASYHFVVDDSHVIQVLPVNEVSWNAGDGRGNGNYHSIAIEICESGDRKKTVDNCAKLTAMLMRRFSVSLYNTVQHNHWSGKNCPRILRDKEFIKDGINWEWFQIQVTYYMQNGGEKEVEKVIIYDTMSEVPEWARASVKWALDMKILSGTGGGKLGLTDHDIKTLCFIQKYDKVK